MNKKFCFALVLFFSFSINVFSQVDSFSGTWTSENLTSKKEGTLNFSLAIAKPFANILYPALLKINYAKTEISYRLLLVKNKAGQLIIGQNKIAAAEFPFSLDNTTSLLSGYLLKTNSKQNNSLQLKIFSSSETGFRVFEGMDSLAATASSINTLLNKSVFNLKKTNAEPWQSPYLNEIIQPGNSGNYYGLSDSLITRENNISIKLSGNMGNDKKFSASLNNQYSCRLYGCYYKLRTSF